jgi:hypothetical protein
MYGPEHSRSAAAQFLVQILDYYFLFARIWGTRNECCAPNKFLVPFLFSSSESRQFLFLVVAEMKKKEKKELRYADKELIRL